jgi:TATA-box binding protein (TBP) (component of TFIID and TFIIIB)
MLGKTKLMSSTQTLCMETPILTTMVVLYNMGVHLNTDKLAHELPLEEPFIKIEKQGVIKRGSSKKDSIRRRDKTPAPRRTTGFGNNSITLVLLSDGDGTLTKKEITVKIFQNGVFHITGVLDEKYDRDVTSRIQRHIVSHCPSSITEGDWTPESRRVVLMNYKTNLRGVTNLSRERLYTSVRAQGYRVNYEPEVYPAVKIYFPEKRWIAKVFRTGNIILTGMTTAEECEELTRQLTQVLSQSIG